MTRSVAAVVVGYLAFLVLVIVCELGISAVLGVPVGWPQIPLGYSVLSLICSALAGVLGGYVAAVIGKNSPRKHALALGIFSELLALVLLVPKLMSPMPGQLERWQMLALILMIVPMAAVGGSLRFAQTAGSAKSAAAS